MEGLMIALTTLVTLPAVFAAVAGVAWGIVGGALPGISGAITMALALPFTYGMDPTTAVILLASTYVGAEYGGSIPAILIRTPGTSAAVTTAIEGYEMHRRGRGGEALGISLVTGVFGGLIGMILLVVIMEPLSHIALMFSAPGYFALGVLALSVIATLSEELMVKGFLAAIIGLAISTVGIDTVSGIQRYTFGQVELLSGIQPILIMVGIFAFSELMIQSSLPDWEKTARSTRIVLPNWTVWKRIFPSTMIGTGLGSVEGAMPGAGATVASFMSYNEAKRWSKHPEEFGKGSPEGIAAPEAANNAVTATALVPTLTFGIPGSGSMAVLLGGLILHGVQPGPLLMQNNPELIYGLYGGLFVANISQLLLGIVLLGPCIWLVNQPKPFLMGGIFALIVSGIYSVDHSVFHLYVMIVAGMMGYFLRICGFPLLPLVLGLVLGSMIERNYRRSVDLSYGDHSIFYQDPVAAILLGITVVLVAGSMFFRLRKAMRGSEAAAASG